MLTVTYARSCFDYDGQTGALRWKWREDIPDRLNRKFAGKVAGSLDADGYRIVSVKNRSYRAHRVIWLIMTGEWPDLEIDHRDLNKDNNAWLNLRLATTQQNHANTTKNKNNTSGYKNVHWHEPRKKWMARKMVNGRKIYIGLYDTPEAAHTDVIDFSLRAHGEFARAA